MDPEELAVCFEALSNDAKIWDSASDTLDLRKHDLNGIQLDRGAFSFAAMDVADTYAQLHTTVLALLQDGADATRNGAAALRHVRQDFEHHEDITSSSLYKIWQPAD